MNWGAAQFVMLLVRMSDPALMVNCRPPDVTVPSEYSTVNPEAGSTGVGGRV